MDQATFEYHFDLKGDGEKTDVVSLLHLTDDERALFNWLKHNNWRVESKRLDGKWVAGALSSLHR